MSKNRTDLLEGQRLPQDWLDSIQEFLSTQATPNFNVIIQTPTTLRVQAGADNAQVGIGINGKWRYISANADAAAPGGLTVGDNPLFVAASASSFTSNPTPPPTELDSTDYTFRLIVKPVGQTPSGAGTEALWRQVGVATWDGAKFTDVRLSNLWGVSSLSKHAASHNPGGADTLDYHGLIHPRGTLAGRPVYGAAYAGVLYYATDVNGGTLYRGSVTLAAWEAITLGLTSLPNAHETTHLPGGADALPWAASIHGATVLVSRPAAAAGNAGFLWLVTDVNGGTLYRSDGAAWAKAALGATETPVVGGGSIASAATLAPTSGEFFTVTGTTTIDNISYAGATAGKLVRLAFQGAAIMVRHNGGGTGNIRLVGGIHAGFVANEMLKLVFDGTNWIEDSRSPTYLSGQGGIILNGSAVPSGLLAEDASAISRTSFAALLANATFTLAGTTTSGSAIVTGIPSTANLAVGMKVEGVGIPTNTTVLSIDSGTQIHLSANATANGSPTMTFFPHGNGDGSTTFNLADSRGRADVGFVASGGHADMAAIGANEGVALIFRRMKHRTSNSLGISVSAAIIVSGAGSGSQPATSSGVLNNGTAPTDTLTGSIGTNNANDPLDTPAYYVRPKFTRV